MLDDFGLAVYFGPMRIAFRETVLDGVRASEHFIVDNVGSARYYALRLLPPARAAAASDAFVFILS